jgi:hypothetical protein
MKEKKEETPTKVKVTEADFNFLKKVNGLKDDILIKRIKMQEKGKKEKKEVTTVLVVDDAMSYMVQATQLAPVFKGTSFGMKNIKGFLKAVTTYGEMEEHGENFGYLLFTSDKKRITYKKLDETTIQQVSLPIIDTTGYVSISLTQEEIKEIQDGLKNDLSDFASLIVGADNKLTLKIGELSFDNIYEQEIKEVTRKDVKDKSEIKFLTKLAYLTRLFTLVDEGSKTTLFLKACSPLIFVEKGSTTHTKTIIAPAVDAEDEGKVDSIIGEGELEEDN